VGITRCCAQTPNLSIGATVTTATTITGRVAEMHAGMAAQPPNEVMGAFGREQAELAAAGLPDGIAAAGTLVADGTLLDPHGTPTTLYGATGGGGSVLVSTAVRGARTATSPWPPTRPSCSRS
jgi:hypothetical protein